jgi:UDP-arabinose 4-epimerase
VLVADPAAARQAIRFAPRYSDLDTIMRTAWPFFGP